MKKEHTTKAGPMRVSMAPSLTSKLPQNSLPGSYDEVSDNLSIVAGAW